MSEASSDDELLERYVIGGDRAALDALVRRHINFVYGAARRQMRGRADAADDVTQAVFLVLAKRAKSVPAGRLSGWLFRVTRYAAANARRAESRRARHERNSGKQESVMPTLGDESSEMMCALDDALASLRESDREALLLRYFRGEDIAAVSARFGTSQDTAQRRISRAVDRLRQAFIKRGFRPADAAIVVGIVTLAATTTAPASTVASVTTAVASSAGATVAAASISKGVGSAMWGIQLKAVAAVAISSSLVAGVAIEVARNYNAPPPVIAVDAYRGVWSVVGSDAVGPDALRLPPSAVVRITSDPRALTFSSLDNSDHRQFVFGKAGPPVEIDTAEASPVPKRLGLIERRGDELWIAFGPPNGARPVAIDGTKASASVPLFLKLRRTVTAGAS